MRRDTPGGSNVVAVFDIAPISGRAMMTRLEANTRVPSTLAILGAGPAGLGVVR